MPVAVHVTSAVRDGVVTDLSTDAVPDATRELLDDDAIAIQAVEPGIRSAGEPRLATREGQVRAAGRVREHPVADLEFASRAS